MARRGRKRKDGTSGDDTDIHIIYQLRKAIVLNGRYEVAFKNGDKEKISPNLAQYYCNYYDNSSNSEKEVMQAIIARSYEDFKNYREHIEALA